MNDNRPIVFALVLKTGGECYDYKYVNNIVEGIKSNVTVPHRIVCLTDDKRGLSSDIDDLVRFKHNWPKWWGKIELFRPDLFDHEDQVFFIDLDTFIVGSLDEIAGYRGEFCALRDFYNLDVMASGFMSWNGSRVNLIYEKFCKSPDHFMKMHEVAGDQAFIRAWKPPLHDHFQDRFPNQVVSYKVHCRLPEPHIPNNARVVCFHGTPKPHEIKNDLQAFWKQ